MKKPLKEWARVLGVHYHTVRNWTQDGLGFEKYYNCYLVDVNDLVVFLEDKYLTSSDRYNSMYATCWRLVLEIQESEENVC